MVGRNFVVGGTRKEAVIPRTEVGLVQVRVAQIEVLKSV